MDNKQKNFFDRIFKRKDIHPFREYIKDYIIESGVKNLNIQKLSPLCGGISIPTECTISEIILNFDRSFFLYILFHEIAHQYQYKKHGKDLMLSTYTTLPLDEAINHLSYIESIADRLAILKLRQILPIDEIPDYRYYGNSNTSSISSHLKWIRSFSKGLSIEEINKKIYEKYRLI